MVAAAGAGPAPIPCHELSVDILAEGIKYCLTDLAIKAASAIATKMDSETGIKAAVSSFHRHLPLERLSCDMCPGNPAVWTYSTGKMEFKMSNIAAATLVARNLLDPKRLKMYVRPLKQIQVVFLHGTNRYQDMHSILLLLKIVGGTLSQAELLPSWGPRQISEVQSWDFFTNHSRNIRMPK